MQTYLWCVRRFLYDDFASLGQSPSSTDTDNVHWMSYQSNQSRFEPIRIMANVCMVCGDKATKLRYSHYGATSCFSCRAFFRRAIEKGSHETYSCTEQRNCDIKISTRKKCPFCRFQKCLDVGMKHPMNKKPEGNLGAIGNQPVQLQEKSVGDVKIAPTIECRFSLSDELSIKEIVRIDRENSFYITDALDENAISKITRFVKAALTGKSLDFPTVFWAYTKGIHKLSKLAMSLEDFNEFFDLSEKKTLLLSNLDPMFNIRLGHFFHCKANNFLEQLETLAIFDVTFFRTLVGWLPIPKMKWNQFCSSPWATSREHELKFQELMSEIRTLELNPVSTSLFTVVALFDRDLLNKDEPESTSRFTSTCCSLQLKYAHLLRRYLLHHHSNGELLFQAYMAMLSKLREMAHIMKSKSIEMSSNAYPNIQQLIDEL